MPFESVSQLKAERPKAERPQFERKSLQELTEKGGQRIENAKARFRSMKDSIKGRFGILYGKIKGAGSEVLKVAMAAPEIVAAAPEIGKYAYERGKAKAEEVYEGVADTISERVAQGRFNLNRAYLSVIEKAKNGFNSIENRGFNALTNFSRKVEQVGTSARQRIEQSQGLVNYERDEGRRRAIEELIKKARSLGLEISAV